MPEMRWSERVFTQTEAADLSGLHYSTLRDWISTCAAPFVSERRRGQRLYSCQDIVILRIAHLLTLGGMVTLTAVAAAWEQAREPPPEGAMLFVRNGAVSTSAVRRGSLVEMPGDDAIQIIRLGEIAERTLAACQAQYEVPA